MASTGGVLLPSFRDLISKDKQSSSIKELLINGITVRDESIMANELNTFFTGIGSGISARDGDFQMNFSNPHSLFLYPTSPTEIQSIISQTKITRPNNQQLPVSILRECSDILAPFMSSLVNESFVKGIFPNILKHATITPIFKGGNSALCNNYRPISVLSVFSKIFERAISTRITKFISKYSLLSDSQYGFVKGKCTQDALLQFIEEIYDALNAKKYSAALYIDLRKAFDSVCHSILISKLEKYGIRGTALDWFKSYLSNRTQCVKINNTKSNNRHIESGVPQGSILGPTLFILFFNDFSSLPSQSSRILYADDTTILLNNDNINELTENARSEISTIDVWLTENNLQMNVEKSCWILFTNRSYDNLDDAINLKLCNSSKSLGVIFDSQLSFSMHIENIVNKVSKLVGIFYKLNFLPNKLLINLYYALVYPHLIYCILIWGGTYRCYLKSILLLQKKLVRIITKSEYLAHTNPLFFETGILKIEDLYEYHVAIYAFKNRQSFVQPSHGYITRNSNSFVPNFSRLNITQRSLRYCAPKLLNSLPSRVRDCKGLYTFKLLCKKYFLERYV